MSEKRQKDAAEMPETKKEDPIEDNDEEDDYDEDEDDGNYDDDHNNNYICESDDDDYETNEHDLYENDPEYFDYECFPLQKIDWIVDKKCERIVQALKLDDKLDAVYLLKQYKWNCGRIVDLYNKDKSAFMSSHFSDDNNNNSKNTASYDKRRLVSYLNIFNDAGPTTHKTYRTLGPVKQHTQANYCNICCNQIANADVEMLALDECGHFFCAECWRMHFESLITSSGSSVFECMQTKCKAMVSKDFVVRCLGGGKSKTLLDKYRQLVTIDLIKESDDLQMCPGEEVIQSRPSSSSSSSSNSRTNSGAESTPNSSFSFSSALMNTPKTSVTHVNSLKLVSTVTSTPTISFSFAAASPVVVSGASSNAAATTTTTTVITKKCHHIVWIKSKPASRRVVCTQCKTQYCFLCTLPYHAPNDCQTIRKWNVKCQDDSETRNYLLVHTQDCPKCKVCIEKNGGCSHMTCNRCKHEFCWVCANDWKTHGATYDCNRYKGNPEQDNAREALNRYTHYYHRWINHSNSLKFEKALREQCQLKIQEKIMNRGGGTLVDWEFLTEAVEVLTRARFTLQYTYPYAYYLNDNESKLLFENIQAELEREVENLSHSLEKVNLNDKYNIKIQMNIVEKRRKTLLKDFIK